MPVCVKCGKVQPSVEISRRSKLGLVCKDKSACANRQLDAVRVKSA